MIGDGLVIAARMGTRAGESYVATGVWPKQPFTAPGTEGLAGAWRDAMFEAAKSVLGASVSPEPDPPDASV